MTHEYGTEPWRFEIVFSAIERAKTKSLHIFDADDNLVCTLRTKRTNENFSTTDIANAERIVASVNWCKQ